MQRLHRWWEDKYVPPENHRNSGIYILQGHYERHWTARWAQIAWAYFKEHHRWIIGLLFALAVALFVKRK